METEKIVLNSTPNTFTLICFAICLSLIALAIIGVIVYVHRNNELMKTTLKSQNHTEFEEFKDTLTNMNNGLIDNVVKVLRDPTIDTNMLTYEMSDARSMHIKNQRDLLNIFDKLRKLIKEDLNNTITNTNAVRTGIYLFHNGTKSLQGLEFLKTSCIAEKIVVGSGIKERMIEHTNLPINLFDDMFDKLVSTGRYIIMNDEETMQTERSKFISNSKIRYSLAVCIYDNSNNILGFILSEYDHAYTKQVSDAEYKKLFEFAKKIAPVLSFSEYADTALKNTDMDL